MSVWWYIFLWFYVGPFVSVFVGGVLLALLYPLIKDRLPGRRRSDT